MRVLIDYRPALSERSGVGEYAHRLVCALLARFPPRNTDRPLDLTLFSSSWKDRLTPLSDLAGASIVDCRVPVSVLNFAWHRLDWPKAETLTGRAFDVTHSLHPLLMPSHDSARIVTIHDLNFLNYPQGTRAEIRRDYPVFVRAHAHRADRILTISDYTAREIERRLGVPRDRIAVCHPGAPAWPARTASPDRGYVLFLGTLEPRKNIGGLLDAYERLAARRRDLPQLLLAGRATDAARGWLERLTKAPLEGLVKHIGYVQPDDRRSLYEGARLLVQPSFDEGFGLPVLEAMTVGVPVVASERGAIPEVLGDAGLLIDPDEPDALAGAIERMIDDGALAAASAAKGADRARRFTWDRAAGIAYDAYQQAIEHRQCASA